MQSRLAVFKPKAFHGGNAMSLQRCNAGSAIVCTHRPKLRAFSFALGLQLLACGPQAPDASDQEPAVSLRGAAHSQHVQSTSQRAGKTEYDLAQLGRMRVNTRVTEKDLRDRYIVEVAAQFDPQVAASEHGVQTMYTFTAALHGFSAYLQPAQLERMRQDPRVVAIEPVQMMQISAVQNMDADGQPWGLDRISQTALPLDKKYSAAHDGAGIRVYIVDTGIDKFHPDIDVRALRVFDAFGGVGEDYQGHGTHVAATVGGTTYGVAKNVQLRGVRVFDDYGKGTSDTVIAGVEWITAHGDRPAVVNMSLGGGNSDSLKRAVQNLAAAGFFPVVSAGNSSDDACNYSPANTPGIITVGATDRLDQQATYSNYGRCVGIYAPGTAIRSAWLADGINDLSGTSMAAPHVAGVAALYKQTYGDTDTATLQNWLKSKATRNALKGLGAGSPNLLLFQPL